MIAAPWLTSDPYADAGPVALPGRGVEHPQPAVVGPVRSTRVIVVELRSTDLPDPRLGVEVVESARASRSRPAGPADEGVGRTPCAGWRRCHPCRSRRARSGCARGRRSGASGSSARPGWGRARRATRCRSTRVSSSAAGPGEGHRQGRGGEHQPTGVGPVDDHHHRSPGRERLQRQPPLLELVGVLRPDREEQRHRLVRHRPVRRRLAGEPARGQLVGQPLAGESGVACAAAPRWPRTGSGRRRVGLLGRLRRQHLRLAGIQRRLGPVAAPLGVEGARLVDPVVGVGAEEVALPWISAAGSRSARMPS